MLVPGVTLHQCQMAPFMLRTVPRVQALMQFELASAPDASEVSDDDTRLFHLSLQLEPRRDKKSSTGSSAAAITVPKE